MRNRLVIFLATGFGAGYVPSAPGTAGSLLGLCYWWLLARTHSPWIYALVLAVGVLFAVWCAGEAAEVLRKSDPPVVVIDEIAAVPLAMLGLGADPWKIIVAFVLFRLFDVWKPPPVRQAQHFTAGLGIVLDDLLAAVYACAGTHAIVLIVSWLKG